MELPFNDFLNFAELMLEKCANILSCKRIWNSSDKDLSLSIPLFGINLFLPQFQFFLRTKVLGLLRRYHKESLELFLLLPQLDMLQSQSKLGEAAYDERFHLQLGEKWYLVEYNRHAFLSLHQLDIIINVIIKVKILWKYLVLYNASLLDCHIQFLHLVLSNQS